MKLFAAIVFGLLLCGCPLVADQRATPDWFDWVAKRHLNFLKIHDYYVDVINKGNFQDRFAFYIDLDGLFALRNGGGKLRIPTTYGELDAHIVRAELCLFAGYQAKTFKAGLLVTGSIMELGTDTPYSDLNVTSSDTNDVSFRHGEIFVGAYCQVNESINFTIGQLIKQVPNVTVTNGNKVFQIDSGGVQMGSEPTKWYLAGSVNKFRVNALWGDGDFNLFRLLYEIVMKDGLGQLLPSTHYSNLYNSLNVGLSWNSLRLSGSLFSRLGLDLQLFDDGSWSPNLNFVYFETVLKIVESRQLFFSLTGRASYANISEWDDVLGYEGYFTIGYKFSKEVGAIVMDIGYGRDYLENLLRLPVLGANTIKLRIRFEYFL